MTEIDATTRMAYVDGELDEIARRRVERAIAIDPVLEEAVARDRALRERLQARFAPYAEAPVPGRFRALLAADIVPIAAASRPWRRGSRYRWAQGAAIAATLVLGLWIGRQTDAPGLVSSRNGTVVARGRLETALDTQLAATQANDAPIRIGLTFRNHDGSICRTFSGDTLQGIACRDNRRWDVARMAAGERGGSYRQASSGALVGQAQDMMAGSPFSAGEEAAARNREWK